MRENTLLMQPTRAMLKAAPGLHFARKAGLATLALCLLSGAALAQRGAVQPPEHANQEPVNHLPNPYETQRDFGTLPDGRNWGSVSAVNIDIDGVHVWAGDRCGS
nr:hypothetical protein [Gammaproteobacteria bacterium]